MPLKCPFPPAFVPQENTPKKVRKPSEAATIQCNTKQQSEKGKCCGAEARSLDTGHMGFFLNLFLLNLNFSKMLQADVAPLRRPETVILHRKMTK